MTSRSKRQKEFRKRLNRSFFEGAASIPSIDPVSFHARRHSPDADAQALRNAWVRVGDCLRSAMTANIQDR